MKFLSFKIICSRKCLPKLIVVLSFLLVVPVVSLCKTVNDFQKDPEKNRLVIDEACEKVLSGSKDGIVTLINLADQGDPIAQEKLFILHFESNAGVSDSLNACKYGLMAYSFWRKQIRVRPDHSYQLALKAMKEKDIQNALKNLRSSAYWGFGDASFQLAKLYLKGDHVEKNADLAGKLVNHSLQFINMAKKEAVLNECLANIRVIDGAIDMHNMDHKDAISEFDESMIQSGGLLLTEGYLKNPIKKPTSQCHYELGRDEYEHVFIQCTSHGSAYSLSGKLSDGLVKPESDLGKILWADMKKDSAADENVSEENIDTVASKNDDSEDMKTAEIERKACFANVQTILGGVEMYNMDHPEGKISSFDENMLDEDGLLGKDGYLTKPVQKPTPDCHYESDGDLAGEGVIRCTVHGPPVKNQ